MKERQGRRLIESRGTQPGSAFQGALWSAAPAASALVSARENVARGPYMRTYSISLVAQMDNLLHWDYRRVIVKQGMLASFMS